MIRQKRKASPGRPVTVGATERVLVTLLPGTKKRVAAAARRRGVSGVQWIREAIEICLRRQAEQVEALSAQHGIAPGEIETVLREVKR